MKECIQQCISTRFSIFLEKRPYYIDELCKISGQNHIVNSNSSLRLKRIRTLRRINRIRIFSFVEFPLFGLVSHVTKIRLKRTSYIFLLLQCLKYHFIIYLFINIFIYLFILILYLLSQIVFLLSLIYCKPKFLLVFHRYHHGNKGPSAIYPEQR